MKYQRTYHPTVDGHYFVRLPDYKTWHTGLLIGGATDCPVFAGGVSGAAIPLNSLRGAEFAGPVPRPGEEPDVEGDQAAWLTIAGMLDNIRQAVEGGSDVGKEYVHNTLGIAINFANNRKGGEA